MLFQKRCVNFYQNERDFVKFNEKFKGNITYLDKLKVRKNTYVLGLEQDPFSLMSSIGVAS